MDSKLIFSNELGLQQWSEELADVTVICGSETFKLHRVVLCAHSELFRKALCGNFA
ncbi:hypothetical protein MCOR25_011155, partial [Pyricularia grisea]